MEAERVYQVDNFVVYEFDSRLEALQAYKYLHDMEFHNGGG